MEWFPASLDTLFGQLLAGFVVVAVLPTLIFGRRRLRTADALILVGLTVMAYQAIRFLLIVGPIGGAIAAVVLSPVISDHAARPAHVAGSSIGSRGRGPAGSAAVNARPDRPAGAGGRGRRRWRASTRPPQAAEIARGLPVGAVAWMDEHDPGDRHLQPLRVGRVHRAASAGQADLHGRARRRVRRRAPADVRLGHRPAGRPAGRSWTDTGSTTRCCRPIGGWRAGSTPRRCGSVCTRTRPPPSGSAGEPARPAGPVRDCPARARSRPPGWSTTRPTPIPPTTSWSPSSWPMGTASPRRRCGASWRSAAACLPTRCCPVPSNGHWMPLTSIVAAASIAVFEPLLGAWRAAQLPFVLLSAALVPFTAFVGWELWRSRQRGLGGRAPGPPGRAVPGPLSAGQQHRRVRRGRARAPCGAPSGRCSAPRAGWWLVASGALAGVATLTRVDGLLLAVAPAVAWWVRPGAAIGPGRRGVGRRVPAGAGAVAGAGPGGVRRAVSLGRWPHPVDHHLQRAVLHRPRPVAGELLRRRARHRGRLEAGGLGRAGGPGGGADGRPLRPAAWLGPVGRAPTARAGPLPHLLRRRLRGDGRWSSPSTRRRAPSTTRPRAWLPFALPLAVASAAGPGHGRGPMVAVPAPAGHPSVPAGGGTGGCRAPCR